jgi:hypothetical protein
MGGTQGWSRLAAKPEYLAKILLLSSPIILTYEGIEQYLRSIAFVSRSWCDAHVQRVSRGFDPGMNVTSIIMESDDEHYR